MLTTFFPGWWQTRSASPRKQLKSALDQIGCRDFGRKIAIPAHCQTTPTVGQTKGLRHLLFAALGCLFCWNVFAANTMDMQEHARHHHGMDTNANVKRSEADYKLPTVKLVRNDGATTTFPNEIDDGRPVILDFIYTSCTDICPMSSLVFSQIQKKLDKDLDKVHLVSISIDPEYDTPERLTAYAKRYNASAQWQHYTGTIEASIAMQKAFDSYRGDKMNHTPVTYIRTAPGQRWVRLDGFANPDEIIRELPEFASSK